MFKKLGIGCLSIMALLVVVGIIAFIFMNESLPEGNLGPEADALANSMLERLDKEAWDSLNYISWSFMNQHHYMWDKRDNVANIRWADNEVLLDLDQVTGVAKVNGEIVDENRNAELTSKAWGYWCNDSFWLYAPYKIFDKGTSRSIVKNADGSKALLITYEGGGVTPGDSYLWLLDESDMPYAYKMWVSIIPLGGIHVEWKDWKTLEGGAMIAQNHPIAFANVTISDIKSGQNVSDLGVSVNPFN